MFTFTGCALYLTIKHVLSRAIRSFRGTIDTRSVQSSLCVTDRYFEFSRPRHGKLPFPNLEKNQMGRRMDKKKKKKGTHNVQPCSLHALYQGYPDPSQCPLFYSTRKRNRSRFFRRERVKWKLSRDSRRYSVIRNSMNSNNQHGYRCFTWYREGYITCTIGGWVRHGWLLAEWEWESHIYIERRGNPTRHSKVHSLRVCSGVLSVPSTHDIHSSRLRARGNSRPSTFPRCTRAASGINLFVNRHGHSNQLQPWSSLYSRKYFFLTTWSFWSFDVL